MNLSLFTDYVIIYKENLIKSMEKILEIFKKLETSNKYTKENFVFIYTSKKSNVIFKNYSNIKNISYLGIFLTDVQRKV